MNTRKLILATAFAGTALVTTAATIKVDASGAWEGSVTTLAAAFKQHAADGDEILVRPGVYEVTSPLEVKYDNLTLKSCDADGNPDAAGTVIDAKNGCRILTASGKSGVTLVGFTLRNGAASGSDADGRGGAVYFDTCKTFAIRDCVFENCTATTGGGLCFSASSATAGSVSNCVVRGNAAATGAGVSVLNGWSNVTFEDCVISNNTATVPSGASWQDTGAAIACAGVLTMKRCSLVDNTAVNMGATLVGGHLAIGSAATFSDCTIRAEVTAGGYGAVAYLSGGSAQSYSNCTFDVSGASGGFGLLQLNGDGKNFYNCTFKTSGAAPNASFIYSLSSGNHLFRNCRFTGLKGTASVLHFNIASAKTLTVENCTFANNASSEILTGGDANLSATFVNCILMGSLNPSCANVLSNCCLSADVSGATAVDCVYSATPGFQRVKNEDWRLRSDSPCLDKGLSLGWMDGASVDLGGRPRVAGERPDIGCYERQDGETDWCLRVVASEADKTGDWADALTSLQSAVDEAGDDDLILVRSGRYVLAETVTVANKTVTIRSCSPTTGLVDPEGTILDGDGKVRAMSVTASELKDDSSGYGVLASVHHPILVEGFTFTNCFSEADGGAVYFQGAAPKGMSPAKIVNCAFLGNRATGAGGALFVYVAGTVEGCTFKGNVAGGAGGAIRAASEANYSMNVQAGWNISESESWYRPVIRDCVVEGNVASGDGGGVACAMNAILIGCTIAENQAGGTSAVYGGGVNMSFGSHVRDCIVRGNSFATGGYGSALYLGGAGAFVSNTVVTANKAGYGAVHTGNTEIRCLDSVLTNNVADAFWGMCGFFRQCLFADNPGRAICGYPGADKTLTVENCTFANNKGGALSPWYSSAQVSYSLVNCIVTGNGTATFNFATSAENQSVALTNVLCDVEIPESAVYSCENVFAGAPKFMDAAAGDYRLKGGSAARDKASRLDWMTEGSTDLAGQSRLVNLSGKAFASDALPDLGCYEAQDPRPGLLLIIR